MTPPETSSPANKTVAPPIDDEQSNRSESELDEPIVLLPQGNPHGELLYHSTADSQTPICNNRGAYIAVPKSEAEERADRHCGKCHSLCVDGGNTNACPKCGQEIALTHWAHHFRQCDGDSEFTGGNS